MSLNELKARVAAWRTEYDALIDERDQTPGDVTAEHSARFDELHEEADVISAELEKHEGADAERAARGFKFLFRNVGELGRAPRHVVALCEAAIA
jgi:Mor family transcriptional regulator